MFKPGRPLDIMHVGRSNLRQAPAPLPTGVKVPAPAPVLLPPTFFPYPGSRRLFSSQSATIAAANPTVVATVTLQAQEIGVISDVEIGINNMLATTLVTWTIRMNGSPIQWGPLTLIPRGATYAGDAWAALGLLIPVGVNVVDILATVSDAGTYLIGAGLTGWVWTPMLENSVREGRVS